MNEQITSCSPEETGDVARRFLARLPPGRVILALHGELGSGKTCFVQGLARALDIRRPVTSPTFTLIHEYQGTRKLIHVDLYRIRSADEALQLGFEEYLDTDGIVAVEWAERAAELFPPDTIHLHFTVGATPAERHLQIRHTGRASLRPARPV